MDCTSFSFRVAVAFFAVAFIIAIPIAPAAGGLDLGGKEWVTVGGDLGNTRYSTLAQIDTKNVQKLGGAWFKELPTVTRTPPVVTDGMLFISDRTAIYALDLRNGDTIWEYKPERGTPARGGVAIGRGLVFSGLSDSRIVALEERTGRLVWTGYIGNAPPGAASGDLRVNFGGSVPEFSPQVGSIANAPTYLKGVVISGLTGGDGGVRGKISGLDATTGKLIWNFYVIPSPRDSGSQTWPQEQDALQRGGGAVWTQGAADPDLGLVFYGTGNPVPTAGGEVRRGDNLYTASVVALDVRTGKLKWHYQLTHHDLWEMDVSTPLVLYTASIDGRPRTAVAAMRTDGYLFSLDRETGKPIYPVEERPVRQDARVASAPTQPFPVGADRFGPSCTDSETLPQGFSPGCYFDPPFYDRPNIALPLLTARQAPMSYDPRKDYFYVMGVVTSYWYRRVDNPFSLVASVPPGSSTYGIYAAIDAKTHKIVWQKRSPWGLATGSGALTTAGGLLFHMEGDGTFEASDATTGDILWRFQTGFLGDPGLSTGGGGVPVATYAFEGTQYVAAPMGKGLWAFKLGGSMRPRPAPPPPPRANGFTGIVQPLRNDGSGEIVLGGLRSASIPGQGQFTDEYTFLPARARIKPGSPFKWTNLGKQRHTIVSSDGSWTTGPVDPGQSAVIAIAKPGTYEYFCQDHPWSRGQLIVRAASESEATSDNAAFTSEQVVRGKFNFERNCSSGCHMPDLSAGERAPALAGDSFLQHWQGLRADALFERIRNTMPQQNPHSLSDQVYIDIVAFLLQANGLPAGSTALTSDSEALKRVIVGSESEPGTP